MNSATPSRSLGVRLAHRRLRNIKIAIHNHGPEDKFFNLNSEVECQTSFLPGIGRLGAASGYERRDQLRCDWKNPSQD
ncbi:MAG: hypothetical protein M3Y07_17375, partial [Acidobacteriota bacterium]|nr:hypothetical protein [Acidobacteriota bacterium]